MSQNIEQIEAKLCAYIDGALDEREIAEIEKHLAANPAHRQLIEDLKLTRQLVTDLPKEPAPPEVAEAVNGQLEREALLDHENESDGVVLRISRWPQLMSLAAVLVLAAGLGLVVYFVLPHHHTTISLLPATPEAQASQKRPTADGDSLKVGMKDATLGGAGRAEAVSMKGGRAEAAQTQEAARLMEAAKSQLQFQNGGNGAVMFVGYTEDLHAANKTVVNYLTQNNIRWSEATEAELDTARFREITQQLARGAVPEEFQPHVYSKGGPSKAVGGDLAPVRGAGGGGMGKGGVVRETNKPDAVQPQDKIAGQGSEQIGNNVAGTTKPAADGAGAGSGGQALDPAGAGHRVPGGGENDAKLANTRAVIVARRLRADQIEQLSAVLSQGNARVVNLNNYEATLRPEQAAPVVAGLNVEAIAPTTSPSVQVLPPVAPAKADDPKAPSGLRQAPSDDPKQRDDDLSPAGAMPRPVTIGKVEAPLPRTPAPATRPAGPATQPQEIAEVEKLDGLRDCVIVLQNSPAALATGGAATQPAAIVDELLHMPANQPMTRPSDMMNQQAAPVKE